MLLRDKNIEVARNEMHELQGFFMVDGNSVSVLPIHTHLYDQVIRLCEDLKCHSIQLMISAILHDLLLECHTTHNKPRILEHLPKRKKGDFKR